MHPGSRILIYILAALVIPGLSFFLAAILLLAALGAVAWLGRHPLRLVWRTRWLLLVLVLGYGFSVPGDAVWVALGEWAPTWPGLDFGVQRAARLLVLLLWLDILVLSLSSEQLLSGLHAVMRPFALVGLNIRRIALRLALTLKAIEHLERGDGKPRAPGKGSGNLHRLFDPGPDPAIPARISLHHYPIRMRDVLIPSLLLAGWMATAFAMG